MYCFSPTFVLLFSDISYFCPIFLYGSAGQPAFVSTFTMFFIDKIVNIRTEFSLLESSLHPYSFESMDQAS